MRYSAYPAYKDSGVEWLGEVPEHWDVKKLKFLATTQPSNVDKKSSPNQTPVFLCNYTDVYYNEEITPDISFMKATATADQINKFSLLQGDIIITKDSEDPNDIAIPAFVPKDLDGVVCGYHLTMIRSFSENSGAYIKRIFDSAYARSLFATRANGLTRYGLGVYALDNAIFPSPPLKEQTAIANFLDRETAKIDTLITKQQELIKLLQEKRQAVISHAVTKGLNPDAPMKDSGVEWLGEVPEHWTTIQIRRHLPCLEQGKSPQCENEEAVPNEWGVLKTSCVNNGIYNSHANKALPSRATPFPQYEVRNGDVLMSRASGSVDLIGSVAFIYETRPKILLSDKIFRLHLSSKINRVFFTYLMGSLYMRSNIKQAISGAEGMANNITKEAIMGFKFALPPLHEQDLIVDFLVIKLRKISSLIQKTESTISLLQERRTALISAAVTGKTDVRNIESDQGEN